METINASGILFVTSDKRALFLKRSESGDYPGYYDLPGGKREANETSVEAAIRECSEEIGFYPSGELLELSRRISTNEGNEDRATFLVDYTTYIQEIDEEFVPPRLDGEHTGFKWAPLELPPEPLHPGLIVTLKKLHADELGIAKLMAAGDLVSPQRYANLTMFNIRITGTGLSYRSGIKEHVWRDKSIYLNSEFLERCNGLPVILEHPKSSTLNTKEYVDRNIGSVFIPYIRDDEVWAIVKVWDEHAAKLMAENQLSTSPCVVLTGDDQKIKLRSGNKLLIEGKPKLLDHIAVCFVGVWDKGQSPRGIETAEKELVMADDDKAAAIEAARKADEAKTKADADAEEKKKADKALFDSYFASFADSIKDSVKKTVSDAWDEKEKEKADKAKKDAEEKEKADARAKMDAAEREKADAEAKAKADAEAKAKADAEEKEKADAKAKADAEELATLRKSVADVASKLPKQMSDADYAAMADSQVRADRIYSMHGKRAPRPLDGETLMSYRRRMANELREHSAAWKSIDLKAIADDAAFGNVENTIYADAEQAGLHPISDDDDFLREIKTQDTTGRTISTFVGRPMAWMSQFAAPKRQLIGISNGTSKN
jgi:8-oxo-dGTP pyrophosphatase MutT (NUDIX family)